MKKTLSMVHEILHQFVDRLPRYVRRGVGLFWFSEVLKPSRDISINYINFGMFEIRLLSPNSQDRHTDSSACHESKWYTV